MHDITLICSPHKEQGTCNSNELYKIIETINPEIIFEEKTPSLFNACYKEQSVRNSLEANAIKKYLLKHQTEHIPVDTCDIENINKKDIDCLKKDIDCMFDKIFNHEEYYHLENKLVLLLSRHGFSYLNSDQCSEIFDKQHMLEEIIIKNTNDDKSIRTYKLWTEIHDKRENEMINNIYSYSKEHKFNRGLFILGAGHRKSIINKVQKRAMTESVKLNWNYSNYNNIL
jgi:hypothetical protein